MAEVGEEPRTVPLSPDHVEDPVRMCSAKGSQLAGRQRVQPERQRLKSRLRDEPAAPRGPGPRTERPVRSTELSRRSWPATCGRAPPPGTLIPANRRPSPASRVVVLSNPKRSRARDVSSARRGWPSGLVVSQRTSPRKPVSSTMSADQLADRDLAAGAEVDRLGIVVALGREHDALGRVLDVEELARRRAGAPDLDVVGTRLPRVDALLDERRDDVRRRGVEVVAGSVEVHRDEVDDVEAVLLRDTPGPGRGASSWPGRTARSSPPGSRSRGRPPGTAPA